MPDSMKATGVIPTYSGCGRQSDRHGLLIAREIGSIRFHGRNPAISERPPKIGVASVIRF